MSSTARQQRFKLGLSTTTANLSRESRSFIVPWVGAAFMVDVTVEYTAVIIRCNAL